MSRNIDSVPSSSSGNTGTKRMAPEHETEQYEADSTTERCTARSTDAYLYKNHPGIYPKEKQLWVRNVRHIRGERMVGMDLEFLLIGDYMQDYEWVAIGKFHAPDVIKAYRKSLYEKEQRDAIRPRPLTYAEYKQREEHMLINVNPVEIMYGFSKDGIDYLMVKDDKDRSVIMCSDIVKKQCPQLHKEYVYNQLGYNPFDDN